ncbi:MAG TPA: extracellular solute-binding protein [Solirubrobacteraceae bacterium]|nr:extracellular solute-binding protein [Solirubrobacteraceae bacterium]
MRRRITPVATLIAAFLALAVGLAACGDDEGSSSSTSTDAKLGGDVKLWIMPNGPKPKEDMDALVKPFEDKNGVNVDVEVVGWDVQFDRIRNAAISGEGPDITQAGTTQVPFFAALGGFEDISKRTEDVGGEAAYPKGVWQTTQVVGRDGAWALPWFTEARAIYYRKDVLKEAGVDEATAFTDWDAFRATLEKVQQVEEMNGKPIEPFGSPGKKAFDLVHHVMPFVWDAGGAELTDDNKKSAIASQESETGVKFMADLLSDGLYDKSQLERDGTQVENQFKGGRLAVWMGGPWVLGSVKRSDDENWVPAARKNVGIAPMPTGPVGEGFTFVGGSNLMMFKSSKNKEAAWALMKFLSQDQIQADYAAKQGMFPSRIEPQKTAGETDANYGGFFKAIQQGRTYAPIPQWGPIEQAYKARFANILEQAGGGSISDADIQKELQGAEKEANALLAQGTG